MDLTHAERLKTVVRWLSVALGKTQAEIARDCGYENNTYFSQLLNGKKPIAASLDDKLAALHPDLNIEYLRGNSDDMFIPGSGQPSMPGLFAATKPSPKKEEGVYVPAEFVQMITNLSNIIQGQQQTIQSQQETIRAALGVSSVEKGRIG